jgi:flavin reductase (DIM6/NTAB) family NADH-FMN oxidoreductase RutF
VTSARADLAFRVAKLKPLERYKLLSSTVTPRPIACVSTLSKNRRPNAAPFSFFNVFGEDLPALTFGVNAHSPEDHTSRNAQRMREFVVIFVPMPRRRPPRWAPSCSRVI